MNIPETVLITQGGASLHVNQPWYIDSITPLSFVLDNEQGNELLTNIHLWVHAMGQGVINLGPSSVDEGKERFFSFMETAKHYSTKSFVFPKSWGNEFKRETKKEMPYIKQENRYGIDRQLQILVDILKDYDQKSGPLNYTITKLLLKTYDIPEKQSYTIYNEIMGVLSCVQAEFYRRFIAPYEDLKIKENGDVVEQSST